jgi:glycosyltransferase involved in cell wall biosynthesis
MGITIAIDAFRMIAEPKTSGASYVVELTKALAQLAEVDHIYLLFYAEPDKRFMFDDILALRGVVPVWPKKAVLPPSSVWRALLWIQFHIPRILRYRIPHVDFFIAPYHQTPLWIPKSIRVATVIHDFCGLKRRAGYHFLKKYFYLHLFSFTTAWLRADKLIPISEYTRHDMLRLMPRVQGRITSPLLNAVTSEPVENQAGKDLMCAKGWDFGEYFLAYGRGGLRKGVDLTLSAFDRYRREGGTANLILIGRPPPDMFPVGWKEKNTSAVLILEGISNYERDVLYKNAVALLFPSRCEGFGYPLVEAMRQSCPPIAWINTPAAEIIGDCLPLLKAISVPDIVGLMRTFENQSDQAKISMQNRLYIQSMRYADSEYGARLLFCLELRQ